jgi:hypothetical protein
MKQSVSTIAASDINWQACSKVTNKFVPEYNNQSSSQENHHQPKKYDSKMSL